MGRSDENKHGVIGPMNSRNGQTRRALSNINKNIIHAPCVAAVNKRPLSQKNGIGHKKIPPVPVHRPITRKFAAQLAENNPQIHKQENKQSDSILDQPLHRSVTDLEEDEDFNEPMFVQHTEAMLDEIDRMEGIEMEDSNDEIGEIVMDIDCSDKNNPLVVVEYINKIYDFYKNNECRSCVPPNYMENQPDINERMRGILVDWLIEVHYKFELMEETLYLTINLIDRFLAVANHVPRKKLQLVGVTALLLACKYEEVSVPVVDDLIVISEKAYTRTEILDMEKLMANTLQFNFCLPTPYVFMRRFLKAAQSDKKASRSGARPASSTQATMKKSFWSVRGRWLVCITRQGQGS
ncbi:unnamed protein product [Eruca vesicaria subsp. sativa]|uniref:Cyclin-like domain-containing protein n=1 Tax=Eruca vesicaria subsp. sativa TaxID=29727 RepID=A0ABC8L2Z4_ERUVS|nr:unnamed protein product [Eruca vesicaria subsp. sativa]